MSEPQKDISRRQFIGQASCAGVGASALFSTLLSLRLANSLAAQSSPGDYKALVCLFLAGGNDSFNMLAPTTGGEYSAYAAIRGNLALARDSLLSISPSNLGGRTLGLHPSMPELRDLFNAGKLAFVSNVGSLVRPTTLADYRADRHRPLALYSHIDQVKQWQTCIPDKRTSVGWGGRAADIIRSLNTPSMVSMNISLSGQSIFLTGQQAFTYTVGSGGATAMTGYDAGARNNLAALRSAAVDSNLAADYRNLFEKTFAQTTADSLDAYYEFSAALSGVNLSTAVPADNGLAASLAQVARVAAANGKLGARRQVFFVQYRGWDHHDEVLNNQVAMLGTVSKAVQTFWNALGEVGLQNNVTLFSASDFGRTLTSNGNGSDHAWGGNHFVLGGSVGGGKVYGNREQGYYPDFQNLSAIDTGYGRLIPGVSVDEYARDMLAWFGIGNGDMDYVLPAFSSRFGGRETLGMMGASTPIVTNPGTPTTPAAPAAPVAPPTSGGASSGGGGGGGSMTALTTAGLGTLLILKKIADRKKKRAAEDASATTPPPSP